MARDWFIKKVWHAPKSVPFFVLIFPLLCMLRVAEFFYCVSFSVVQRFRKKRVKKVSHSVCVISVGNLTVGGTGKSVVVRHLVSLLGSEFCGVVMRGYRGKNERKKTPLFVGGWGEMPTTPDEAGDEAYALAESTNTPVVVCSDKYAAAKHLLFCAEKNGKKITTIIVDDGYQTMSLQKDVEIVLLDARAPLGNGHCLPAGPLREKDLSRAGIVLATHADEATEVSRHQLLSFVKQEKGELFARENLFWMNHQFSGIYNTFWKKMAMSTLKNKRFCGVVGIGEPGGFFAMLEKNGLFCEKRVVFDDHHPYSSVDLAVMYQKAGDDCFVTTEKDWVKIAPLVDHAMVDRWHIVRVALGGERHRFEKKIEKRAPH